MDRHIGTAITDTVTANPGMAASSGPSRFRSGVRTGAYLFEDAHVRSVSTFGTDERLQALTHPHAKQCSGVLHHLGALGLPER
jgi:hypothetical protein